MLFRDNLHWGGANDLVHQCCDKNINLLGCFPGMVFNLLVVFSRMSEKNFKHSFLSDFHTYHIVLGH